MTKEGQIAAVAGAPLQANREIAAPPTCGSGYCDMSKAGARNDGTGAAANAPSQANRQIAAPPTCGSGYCDMSKSGGSQ